MYKVLIVDSNTDDRNELICSIPWDNLSCTVCGVDNEKAGVTAALKLRPNIIVADASTPNENIEQMVSEIVEKLPETLFVFLSEDINFNYRSLGVESGNAVCVLKSSAVSDLSEKIENFCWKIHETYDVCSIIIEYKKQLSENKEYMIEKFLTNHISGISKDDPDFYKRARYMGIDMKIPYMLALLKIDNTDSMQNTYSMQFHLKKIISQHFSEVYENMYCINYDSQMVVLLLDFSKINFDDTLSKFYEIQKRFTQRTQMHVTVCLSKSQIPFMELSDAFMTQYEILKREYFTKSGSIILAEEMHSDFLALDNAIKSDLSSEISKLLLGENKELLSEFVDRFYSQAENLGEVGAKLLTYNIVNAVNSVLIEQNLSFEIIFGNEFLVWEKLVHFSSIVDIPNWLKNILETIFVFLKSRPEYTFNEIITQIKKDIDENYSTILSLTEITDKLYFSSGYASKMFKKYTNQTINEYLLERRMQEAKKLLKNSKLKSSEVARKVGYQSNTYFTTAFKKYTGLTPTEYRNSL